MLNYTGDPINATIQCGILTMPDGQAIDLTKIQAAINFGFQETGEKELMEACDLMSKITGLEQGPSGEFVAAGKLSNYIERQPQVQYVIRSLSESDIELDGDAGAFWSNVDGWGSFQAATLFSTKERMSLNLPMSAKLDAEWMLEEEARDLEANRNLENPQERYRLSAMDEGNDHYSVLDTKTQLYWSSEGWQRPDSGWASVLTRSEAARKAYELNRKLQGNVTFPPIGARVANIDVVNRDPSKNSGTVRSLNLAASRPFAEVVMDDGRVEKCFGLAERGCGWYRPLSDQSPSIEVSLHGMDEGDGSPSPGM